MAPLRSSRNTRNAEHNTPARNRAGVVDYDPTDGLPVRKYVLENVKVNQDTAADSTDPGTQAQTDKEDGTYYPWKDLPLPSFFDQLPPHNQELIRRARQGNRNAKISVWDKKTNEYVKYDKAKAMGLVGSNMKSRHLMNMDADNGENDDDEADEDDEDEEMRDGLIAAKKRKVTTAGVPGEDRTFEVRRWVVVPADKADKMTEPKYLADRRPGMPSLYANPAVLEQASGYGGPFTGINQRAGFDLGDGSGLGSALGGGATAPGEAPPARKHNMPPKRKKKKLGGPGRRKAVPVETAEQKAAVEIKEGSVAEKAVVDGEKKEDEIEGEGEGEGEGDGDEGSGDESEGDGSEEGEVSEEVVAAPQITEEVVMEEAPTTASAIDPEPIAPITPAVEEKQVEVITAEVTMEEAIPVTVDASPERQEGETDLLGGLEAALDKQD